MRKFGSSTLHKTTNVRPPGALTALTALSVSVLSMPLLGACSTVDFQQLRAADLAAKPEAPHGAVYYLPKPYLLVAQMPAPAARPSTEAPDPAPPPGTSSGAAVFPHSYGGEGDPKADSKDDASPADTASPTSDFSFGGASNGYILKLVYLPDLTRPMAMSMQAGLGTASLKPTLVNGWALTGFDATADSKTAEILASVAQVIGAWKNPGNKDTGGTDTSTKGGGASQLLRPGLYEFHYDQFGRLVALCPIVFLDQARPVEVARSARCDS
jgi:hypothetical protein